MTVRSAEPNDIYVDPNGKLWRVIALIGEPSVRMREVETVTPDNPVERVHGVSAPLWDGWRKLVPEPPC